ncbi:threonine aspartase 1 isoform X2 [Dendroctonus ponderosae]|uniref:threonine aspartase 1 isoform X2 n=1 Tax=Dendroctonus ponderosae TaxID=77166 RepID=UPI002034C3ED|nr:threonine aspartase 1 isoform X2 [Dendroctonus ponderosae]
MSCHWSTRLLAGASLFSHSLGPHFEPIMIAVHCGAGRYNDSKQKEYGALCRKACRKAMTVLNNNGTALEAVREAITVLEDDPLTNAGFGSNLTLDGTVEGDASVMNGENLLFAACGAVRRIKNPICLAYDIYQRQLEPTPLGLVQPSVMVGDGAYKYAKKAGIKIVNESKLVSRKALKQREKYKAMLDGVISAQEKVDQNRIDEVEIEFSESMDTVGAVCIDDIGNVAAGCSSGGLLLKRPGRMGQAAQYGSGVWADSLDKTRRPSIAVCTTGCGEHLVQTLLAKTIAEDLLVEKNCPTVDLHHCLNEKFMNSRYLRRIETAKLGGALVLKADNASGEVSLMWGHSTYCLGVGYMRKGDVRPHIDK